MTCCLWLQADQANPNGEMSRIIAAQKPWAWREVSHPHPTLTILTESSSSSPIPHRVLTESSSSPNRITGSGQGPHPADLPRNLGKQSSPSPDNPHLIPIILTYSSSSPRIVAAWFHPQPDPHPRRSRGSDYRSGNSFCGHSCQPLPTFCRFPWLLSHSGWVVDRTVDERGTLRSAQRGLLLRHCRLRRVADREGPRRDGDARRELHLGELNGTRRRQERVPRQAPARRFTGGLPLLVF